MRCTSKHVRGSLQWQNVVSVSRSMIKNRTVLLNKPPKRYYSTGRIPFSHKSVGAVGFVIVGGLFMLYINGRTSAEEEKKEDVEDEFAEYGNVRPNLPEYTREEIAKKNNKADRIWVTFKYGVYDVTDFVAEHPGGDKILLAAGNAVDSYWLLYAVHKSKHVLDILEKMRIGNIAKKDRELMATQPKDVQDPYRNDPTRFPGLVVRNQKPFNAEVPPELLVDKYITPNELFFIRNHLPVPQVDLNSYKLTITGKGIPKDVEITYDDLKTKFKTKKVVATLQCAGNRRSELNTKKPVKGLEWGIGAISTAEWEGVLLSDLLEYAKFNPEGVKHVQFEGLDLDPSKVPYGGSIYVQRAIDPRRDVLVAFKMNGKDIPADHGYPVRMIVPGVVGARNVKWLSRIVTSEEESPSFWQQYDYKGFSPGVEAGSNELFKEAYSIQEPPVQSAICEPRTNHSVEPGDLVKLKGYAWSGGGRDIIRVDIEYKDKDEKKWLVADLNKEIEQEPGRAWAWTPFETTLEVPNDTEGEFKVCSRAVDDSYNVQPEDGENIWNFRGVLSNAWSCINLNVKK
jgi:sulfite oxidase